MIENLCSLNDKYNNSSQELEVISSRLNEICDYIEDILSHIDDYRKIANKDGNGKIYRLD